MHKSVNKHEIAEDLFMELTLAGSSVIEDVLNFNVGEDTMLNVPVEEANTELLEELRKENTELLDRIQELEGAEPKQPMMREGDEVGGGYNLNDLFKELLHTFNEIKKEIRVACIDAENSNERTSLDMAKMENFRIAYEDLRMALEEFDWVKTFLVNGTIDFTFSVEAHNSDKAYKQADSMMSDFTVIYNGCEDCDDLENEHATCDVEEE